MFTYEESVEAYIKQVIRASNAEARVLELEKRVKELEIKNAERQSNTESK